MSRRPTTSRRFTDSGSIPFVGSLQSKSRSSPILSIGLVVVGALLIVGYLYHGSGGRSGDINALNRLEVLPSDVGNESLLNHSRQPSSRAEMITSDVGNENGASCALEALRALPFLKKAYGDSIRKVLHVGPDTCSVVSKLLKEEETEAWGIEPYDLEEADGSCKSLVRRGIMRVADIKFPLPYRPKSFSLVIVSDAVDYLSPKYLNKTLPDLARVSADGVVMFSGLPSQQRVKGAELAKFGRHAKYRSSSWWIRFFVQTSLEENEAASKKFEQAAAKKSYKPACQIFHLKPLN